MQKAQRFQDHQLEWLIGMGRYNFPHHSVFLYRKCLWVDISLDICHTASAIF